MWFEDFQDGCHGGHRGYQNRTILAILNLHAAPMTSVKFTLHRIYCSGADNNWRLSRWLTWWPSWISERNDFSNFKSPWGPYASHQVWAQSDLGFGSRCGFKIFKMAARPSWIAKRNDLSNSEYLRRFASHQVSAQLNLLFGRRYRLANFKIASMAAILDISKEQF